MSAAIAIVGAACRFPDARTPAELWELVLAQRRAFRPLPPERLPLADYGARDPETPDTTYVTHAALLEGWTFDRARFRVSGSTYRSADPAHWLALEVAADSLADAGFPEARGLPRERTGVLVGNTLTGEFSRAETLRLRWPYVRRTVAAALAEEGLDEARAAAFLDRLERRYKRPFAPVTADTLAGGLANTIAGRIANHFDLLGGGFTVDGACASSLLAVVQAASALAAGDLDAAVVGGVDLSLDPFELVGFAKSGALAREVMRVYDERSAGFWPGEGAGFVVLLRADDARARGLEPWAVLRGWGVSSDGAGGLTRPEADGQLLALERAYARAALDPADVAYFEGHGTGTAVGDATELDVLARVRARAGARPPAPVGSVKANLGHTKAAAGIAGLLKAALALRAGVLPPTSGCERPRAELMGPGARLRAARAPTPWPADRARLAGVSSMGFGGINAHVVLEGLARPAPPADALARFAATPQDAELFLFRARDADALGRALEHARRHAARLSFAELTDLAARLAADLAEGGSAAGARAAVVAASPAELDRRLARASERVAERRAALDLAGGTCVGLGERAARLLYLFPGHAAPVRRALGAWSRRFPQACGPETCGAEGAGAPADGSVDTALAQPAIVAASLAGLRVLRRVGLEADAAVGHSLGELTGLAWAGAIDETDLLDLARARGRAVAGSPAAAGAMASFAADGDLAAELCRGTGAAVAARNSPRQTVIAGDRAAVDATVAAARARGVAAVELAVPWAFHTPALAEAAAAFAAPLARHAWRPLERVLASTVTGAVLAREAEIAPLLERQLVCPALFAPAVGAAVAAAGGVDLAIEVGPGRVLAGIARDLLDAPVAALDVGGDGLAGLLGALAAAWAAGAPLDAAALFADRFARPFEIDRPRRFLVNPCEAVEGDEAAGADGAVPAETPADGADGRAGPRGPADALALVRRVIAARTELPLDTVHADARLLEDLHLNSIAVGELSVEVARALGRAVPLDPTALARASVRELAVVLAAAPPAGAAADEGLDPPGVDAWTRAFAVDWTPRALPPPGSPAGVPAEAAPWRVLAPEGSARGRALAAELESVPGGGLALWLQELADGPAAALLAEAARALAGPVPPVRFLLVQESRGAASFARTAHLELGLPTAVVGVEPGDPAAARRAAREIAAARGFVEARYTADGERRVPLWRPLAARAEAADPVGASGGANGRRALGPTDLLLASGGGKGIGFVCAQALAERTGARLALLGRSAPGSDPELTANLARLEERGLAFRYLRADVADPAAVRAAVRAAREAFGSEVGAVLHAAGTNAPRPLAEVDEAGLRATLAPKLDGARNLLAALPRAPRLFVAFGSVIGRAGLAGEAEYAVANEWLAAWCAAEAARRPATRFLCLEWSQWSEVGMAERLGRVDHLRRRGVEPIRPRVGTRLLADLLERDTPAVVVCAGRLGAPATVEHAAAGLPFQRFLERPRVHVPGVELVVDARLAPASDPWLDDHVLGGERLVPAVLSLEALAQAACALARTARPPLVEGLELRRPVVVPERGTTLRVAALARADGIDVVLRAEATGFQVDHVRARCRFPSAIGLDERGDGPTNGRGGAAAEASPSEGAAPSADELYGTLLFQSGRFRRVRRWAAVRARALTAVLAPADDAPWFARHLPGELVLGDPGARDAALHAIQACIPHERVLPVGAEEIAVAHGAAAGPLVVRARERRADADGLVWDVRIEDERGALREHWRGLRLRALERREPARLPASLLAVWLERRAGDLLGDPSLALALGAGAPQSGRAAGRAAALRALPGEPSVSPARAAVSGGAGDAGTPARQAALAHAGARTLAAAGATGCACDLELVRARPAETWRALLGPARTKLAERLAAASAEGGDAASTRVWAALECLKKAGAGPDVPLVEEAREPDGWVVLRAGRRRIATWVGAVGDARDAHAVAVLVEAT